jgi:hypothetical protein
MSSRSNDRYSRQWGHNPRNHNDSYHPSSFQSSDNAYRRSNFEYQAFNNIPPPAPPLQLAAVQPPPPPPPPNGRIPEEIPPSPPKVVTGINDSYNESNGSHSGYSNRHSRQSNNYQYRNTHRSNSSRNHPYTRRTFDPAYQLSRDHHLIVRDNSFQTTHIPGNTYPHVITQQQYNSTMAFMKDRDQDLQARVLLAAYIQECSHELACRQVTTFNAITYAHRFYCKYGFDEVDHCVNKNAAFLPIFRILKILSRN